AVPDDATLDRLAQQGSGVGHGTGLVGLNPQPEPPSIPSDAALADAQAVLPPPPGELVGLNPQPEPPSRPRDLVGLNPQPEPPSRPRDLVGLNPQPEPPSTPRDFLLALGTMPRLPANLPEGGAKLADRVVAAMRGGDADKLEAAWKEMRGAASGYNADWPTIRNALLRQAFVDSNEGLAAYAESRKGIVAVRQEVQSHLVELAALY